MDPVVYTPQPITPATVQPAPVVLTGQPLTVAYIAGPDGRMVAAYVPVVPAPESPAAVAPVRSAVSPLLINAFLGAGTFALTALGLHLLASFIEALAHLVQTLVILAAIVCGAPVAVQLLRTFAGGGRQSAHQTVIHARKVRIGRLVNKGGAR